MAFSTQILEGFICPICKTNFETPNDLTRHFEELHNDDPEIFKSLKDLFGKAKKKILKQDEIPEVFPCSPNNQIQTLEITREQQEPGLTRSHTIYFKEIRHMRLEPYNSETNKLLMRLDKLLFNLPLRPAARKEHERSIVPWIDETHVNLCPNCAKNFHVTRRKHHCRLCGAIMCHNCTSYLSLLDARKMTSPVSIQDDSAVSPTSERSFSERVMRTGIGLTKLVRSPSSGSLNSVLALVNDSTNAEQHFKVCMHCMNVLNAREKQKEKQFHKPIVCQFYEKMRSYMEETMQLLVMYNKMNESLREGESTYDLQDAQTLRLKIAKLGENIDTISKRILVLGTRDVESPPQGQELRLHQMVRASAMIFLKEQLLLIQPLPSVEEYEALQEERQKRIELKAAYERRLEEQRQRSKEQHKRETYNLESGPFIKENQQQMILDQSQGWGPSTTIPVMPCSMDPLIEQMSNLRAYIKQARADCKFDEVATLENNLREVQSAYFAKQESNNTE